MCRFFLVGDKWFDNCNKKKKRFSLLTGCSSSLGSVFFFLANKLINVILKSYIMVDLLNSELIYIFVYFVIKPNSPIKIC